MITALTDPSQLPNQLQDQQTFDTNMAAMIDNLPLRAQQENALAANMSAYAAGGAYSFQYGFDSSTAAGDPGPGKLRLNAGAQSNAGAIYIDPLTLNGGNIDSLLVSLGANLSLLKGAIRIVKAADPTRWMLFDINEVVAGSGYRALSVTYRASSSASPFTNADTLQVFLDRTGDRAVDQSASVRLDGAAISIGVLAINYTNIFTDNFGSYQIELSGFAASAADFLQLRLATGGSIVTASNYANAVPDSGGTGTNVSSIQIASLSTSGQSGRSLTIDIRGSRRPGYTGVGVRGTQDGTNGYSRVREGALLQNTITSGFSLFMQSGGAITAGEINIYGMRRQA